MIRSRDKDKYEPQLASAERFRFLTSHSPCTVRASLQTRLYNMYRHYAKQRKLGKQQKQAVLSDEESSGDDDEDYTSGAQQAPVESGSDVSDDESGSDDDDDLLPPSQESGAEESAEEDELLPPPPGVPTAEEALDNSICAQPTDVDAQDAEEGPLICVVCPSKVLKRGKMLDVHLASKVS